jgi:uncharacterized protein YcbX
MTEIGHVTQIWRFPVKSMAGERLTAVDLDARGIFADRTWAVRDIALGATTSAKRLPALMFCSARYTAPPPPGAGPGNAPEVLITFPDGGEVSSSDPGVHAALSAYLDRDVELRPLPKLDDRKSYRGPLTTKTDLRTIMGLAPDEPLPDLSMFPIRKLAELTRYATPVGTYADVYPLHVLTDQSLRTMGERAPDADWDVRRFRPGLFVETPDEGPHPEWTWCGGTLRAPNAEVDVLFPTIRCVMPTHAQPGLERNPAITRTIAQHSRRCLGVYGTVRRSGRVAEGDALTLQRSDRAPLGARPDAVASRMKRALMKAGNVAMPRGKTRT